jgi:HSP20 family protein
MLTIWNPLNDLLRFEGGLSRWFDDDLFASGPAQSSGWLPRVDVKETDKEYVLSVELPGVSPKDVSIEVKDGVLTISGEKKLEKEEKKDRYHRVERCYGSFSRSFSLSQEVDETKIDAAHKDGVLVLTLPKKEEVKPRKIEIKN